MVSLPVVAHWLPFEVSIFRFVELSTSQEPIPFCFLYSTVALASYDLEPLDSRRRTKFPHLPTE